MSRYGRRKGHSEERRMAKEWRELGWSQACTTRSTRGGAWITDYGADLANTGPYKVQIKRQKAHVPITTIEEIQCGDGDIPVLLSTANYSETLAVLPWKHLKILLSDSAELAARNLSRPETYVVP